MIGYLFGGFELHLGKNGEVLLQKYNGKTMKKSKLSILPRFGPFFACSDFFANGNLLWHFQVNLGKIEGLLLLK